MANPEHLAKLKAGVKAWNVWREKNPEVGTDLTFANLSGATLSGADLTGADLTGARLRDSNLTDASLTDASLSNAKLTDAKLIGANLRGSNLSAAELSGANLTGANLTGANLHNANLLSANLAGAKLGGAKLTNANLICADLVNADLGGVDLSNSALDLAVFRGTSLDHAILANAQSSNTVWNNLDLGLAVGLETIHHKGPSTIGLDTLYKSKGQIPEIFLRGCGVPDSFITQMKSLIGAEEGIQFYSCFISYSGKDEDFAKRLHARLQQDHVRVWFAPEDIQGGKKLHEQIDEAIRIYDKLLIVLSQNSLTSDWVETELRKARKAERKTGKRKLFPIRLVDYETLTDWECFDADSGKCLATEVREYFIPDFTQWKAHDAFEAAYARLLKDLRGDT